MKNFPHLITNSLTKWDREMLESQLDKESMLWKLKFSSLFVRTRLSLEKQGYTVTDLREFFMKHIPKLYKDSKNETDFSLAWDSIMKYMSFFDYEILYYVIKTFCGDDLKQEMEKYISEFQVYCKRRLCELPQDIFPFPENKDKGNMYFVINKHYNDITASEIKELQVLLSEILNTTFCTLRIDKEGQRGIKLNLKLLRDFDTVFPLSKEQERKMYEISVLKVFSDEQVHYSGNYLFSDIHT